MMVWCEKILPALFYLSLYIAVRDLSSLPIIVEVVFTTLSSILLWRRLMPSYQPPRIIHDLNWFDPSQLPKIMLCEDSHKPIFVEVVLQLHRCIDLHMELRFVKRHSWRVGVF